MIESKFGPHHLDKQNLTRDDYAYKPYPLSNKSHKNEGAKLHARFDTSLRTTPTLAFEARAIQVRE
jgi:hypothetical protein